ncbi:MAG: ketoacyl-ACP synthase III [Clostridia bacterium]|nr:ketoacyl-ACP synthase III [Clostridia bacterium]
MAIKILGTGAYVPEKIVTNDDLAKMVDTSDEWITQRVGIKERRVSETETAADFAVNAAKEAMANANITADELDLIIAATISAENICPTVAGTVQNRIGATCPAFDINSACSGFMFALDTAVSYIARGNIRNILVIGTERLSKLVDWDDRSTCVIFADGAGAMVIAPGEGYLASKMFTAGGDDVIKIPAFGGTSPFYTNEKPAPYIFMDGQETFKFAVNKIVNDVKEVIEKAGMTLDEIDHLVLHQANTRILDFAAKRLKISKEKIIVNIDKYGNTAAASVPIAFNELAKSGRLKRGDTVVMSAFGGGLSSGTCLIRY